MLLPPSTVSSILTAAGFIRCRSLGSSWLVFWSLRALDIPGSWPGLPPEPLIALAGVEVSVEVVAGDEALPAQVALELSLACVDLHVACQLGLLPEALAAYGAMDLK